MASGRTCPHTDADRLQVSGTQLRKALSEGVDVPPEFSRPEVVAILRKYYADVDAAKKVAATPACLRRGDRSAHRIATDSVREQPVSATRLQAGALSTPATGIAPRFCLANWTKLLTSCE